MHEERHIAAKAMCLFQHGGSILVSKHYERIKNENFYRVLGGSIEFYESAEEAVRREIREELGSEIDNLVALDVLENRFVYESVRGHQIIFLFKGDLRKKELYSQTDIQIIEQSGTFNAAWVPVSDILRGTIPLYPSASYDKYLVVP